MNQLKRNQRRGAARKGAAVVEFAVCIPVVLLIGFGFINAGVLVQMQHNSKMLGHMAATDVFKSNKDPQTIEKIVERYEQMAEDLGITQLEVEISETNDIASVRTSMSVSANSLIPVNFQTADSIVTETFVYAPFK